jgi:hypothetical protein
MMFYEALGWGEPTDATKTVERFFWFWETNLLYICIYGYN